MLVRNLPFQAEVPDVRNFCEAYGDVEDVYLPRDYYSKRPKGIAFVQFGSGEACAAAVKGLDGQDFQGKRVQCVVAEHGRKRVAGRQGYQPGKLQDAGAEPGVQKGRRERLRGGAPEGEASLALAVAGRALPALALALDEPRRRRHIPKPLHARVVSTPLA